MSPESAGPLLGFLRSRFIGYYQTRSVFRPRATKMITKSIRFIGHPPEGQVAGTIRKSLAPSEPSQKRIFLLSPANAAGVRGGLILGDSARSPLAQRLHTTGAPLGEIFSLISGLYFRGKLAYAGQYASPPSGVPGVLVITASRGLLPADTVITLPQLHELAAVPIDPRESRYRVPLERDALLLRDHIGANCEVVLLGSIATPKYVEPLLEVFGQRLKFPPEFVGRGDMSRGGLMLRCQREGVQLTYVSVGDAVRHGARPPKLPPPAKLLSSSRSKTKRNR